MKKTIFGLIGLIVIAVFSLIVMERMLQQDRVAASRDARVGLREAATIHNYLMSLEVVRDKTGEDSIPLIVDDFNSKFSGVAFESQALGIAGNDRCVIDLLETKRAFYSGGEDGSEFVYLVWPDLQRVR